MSLTMILYICIGISSIISIYIWLDYFRNIDVFESEKLVNILTAVLIGCSTPFLSLQVYAVFDYLNFKETGNPVNDLFYSVLGIGLNEELSKIAGAIIAFRILKKHINDTIDYLIYAGAVALGFSLVENFIYIKRFGIDIITSRTFYSALEHIINTTIITYGYFRHRIFNKGNTLYNTVVAVFLAISSHGLFDYFLINPLFKGFSSFFSIIVYLIGINFWVTMLNNANNYSKNFNYKSIHYPTRLFYRLMYWYFATTIIGLLYNWYAKDMIFALKDFFSNIISDGFLFVIVILRISRFKIYKYYYQTVKIQLPFYITKNEDEDFKLFNWLPIKVRGENAFEYFLTSKMNQTVVLFPINKEQSYIKKPQFAHVKNKLMLENETTLYEIAIQDNSYIVYLKPKTRGKTMIDDQFPVNMLLMNEKGVPFKKPKDLKMVEWVYVKPYDPYINANI